MNFKSNVDYQNLSLQYIRNEILVEEIQNNIQFVEKYYCDVDVRYKDIKEQRIVYKQLGIITFSCVEALWKGIVMAVNDICSSRNCNIEKCKYRKFNTLEKINLASADKILVHLTNMRLLYVHPYEMEAIEELQHLRNHVHLTRTLTDDVDPKVFDKIFVEDMLRLYYVTLNQFISCYWYFGKTAPCLKKMDEDGYENTNQYQKCDIKEYFTQKLFDTCYTLFQHKPLNSRDKKRLIRLKAMRDIDEKDLSNYLGRFLYYEGIHYRTEEEYKKAIETFFKELKIYLSTESKFIEEIKQQMQYYKKLYNTSID